MTEQRKIFEAAREQVKWDIFDKIKKNKSKLNPISELFDKKGSRVAGFTLLEDGVEEVKLIISDNKLDGDRVYDRSVDSLEGSLGILVYVNEDLKVNILLPMKDQSKQILEMLDESFGDPVDRMDDEELLTQTQNIEEIMDILKEAEED